MKKLILFSLLFIFISCSKNEDEEFISPIIGTFEGTIDFGNGFVMNTLSKIEESGAMSWDIFLKDENENYIERYYWPSLTCVDVTDDQTNWLYGKIETSETRRIFYVAAAEESGLYTSVANEIVDMPIGWNAHYSVMDFDETKTTYELRNVCVPQEFQLANDELCEGWEQWESETPFIGRRID
tara:strand:+ start:184 stop:732 length:549 start_codon:yes stop_codon:yes gene_type:complete